MLNCLPESYTGINLASSDGKHVFSSRVIGYIDDNNLNITYQKRKPSNKGMSIDLSEASERWSDLLEVTGGKLSNEKCIYYATKWSWDKCEGTMTDVCPEIDNSDSVINTFTRKRYNDAERYLGVRIAPSGQMQTETQYRIEQSTLIAREIEKNYTTGQNTWTLYNRIWCPQVQICLPVTTFNDAQCHEMHKPIINSILSKMGYNSKTPRAVVHGPVTKGALVLQK